jgi:hypothetical protein
MVSFNQSRESTATLSCLPVELLHQVVSNLSNRDIKNLRQTCTFFHKITQLRLDRVFLSPNPRDIKIFTAIAEHDACRLRIQEIIYDDARFWDEYAMPEGVSIPEDDELQVATGVPSWYRLLFEEDIKDAKECFKTHTERPGHSAVKEAFITPSNVEESYKHYQELLQGQHEVISQDRDVDALRYGLTRFPNLRRVTLTIATHGRRSEPFYYTPTIRALPRGLIYPRARGWPGTDRHDEAPDAESWEGEEKEKWRGFCILTHGIARHLRENPSSRITEFRIDVNQIRAGINFRLFDNTESSEYKDLVTILGHSGFKRLDLSLDCTGSWDHDEWAVNNGQFHDLLSNTTDLQHMSLSTNIDFQCDLLDIVGRESQCFPLCGIFPIDKWPNLRHFSLSRFFVRQEDVMGFLAALPPTLESIELSFLEFAPWYQDTYRGLFQDMRQKLGWRERVPEKQPKIIVFVERRRTGAVVDVSLDAEDYLYRDGENPFTKGSDPFYPEKRYYVFYDVGTEVDVFSPNYKRLDFSIYD